MATAAVRRKSLEKTAAPVPELTEIHKQWIRNLEKDKPDLPVGYARALVEMYVKNPKFFTKENIDKMAAQKPPLMQTTNGEIRVLSAEEASEFEAKLPPAEAHTVCENIPSVSNADFFEVTDTSNGEQVAI